MKGLLHDCIVNGMSTSPMENLCPSTVQTETAHKSGEYLAKGHPYITWAHYRAFFTPNFLLSYDINSESMQKLTLSRQL